MPLASYTVRHVTRSQTDVVARVMLPGIRLVIQPLGVSGH